MPHARLLLNLPTRMKPPVLLRTALVICFSLACFEQRALATSEYNYKPGEYVTVVDGLSPNGEYAIAAHGNGEGGYGNFHIYLMNARSGKKIGPLEEIKLILDTGANAYYAKWSSDSRQVSITYRQERHMAVMVRYRIESGRAFRLSGPSAVSDLPPH